MLADDLGNIVVGVCVQAAGAQGQAVVLVVHHAQEAVDALSIHQQAGQAEDIPRGIVHVDGHLDVALAAGGHQSFQEVLQVLPQLLLGDRGIGLEQLVQLCHTLRLPAGEGHVILLGKAQDVVGHGLVIVLDHVLLVEQSSGAVADRVEQVGTGPVKDGHEVVADDLDTELGQVADALLVVLDVLVAGGQADLDVIVDIDRLDHVHVEAVSVDLIGYLLDLVDLPDLAGHLVVQRPDDAGHAGDLLDVAQADGIVALAIPAPTHFHRHRKILLFYIFCFAFSAQPCAALLYLYSSISVAFFQWSLCRFLMFLLVYFRQKEQKSVGHHPPDGFLHDSKCRFQRFSFCRMDGASTSLKYSKVSNSRMAEPVR